MKGVFMHRSQRPRPFPRWAVCGVGVPLLLAGCHQREGQREEAAPPPAPRGAAVAPSPAAVVVDPYDTPYAVVPAQSEHDPCLLPASVKDGAKPQWAPVWTLASRLDGFAEKSQQPTALRAPRPGVGGFCAYKWTDRHALPKRQDFEAIGAVPDRSLLIASTAPAGSIPRLPDTVSAPLLQLFQKQAGGAPKATVSKVLAAHAAKVKAKAQMPVKVAVIDATPTKKGLAAPDRTFHGFSVSRTVGHLACDDVDSPACAEQVVAQLALPIIGDVENDATEDFESGGRTGTFTHLFDAVERAVDAWKPKEQHLVINFSVGWDPVKADPGDENVERIKAQLERASCMGALIVAAAGNYSGSTGPVFPAAFEALKAPTGDACAKFKLDGVAPKPKGAKMTGKGRTTPYAPLVHSVGAVDALDQRLLVNRRWGQPRLAALGASVMVPGPSGIPYTPPLEGTSMSSAIVSGIAAAVWAARPDLDAAGVMQVIYEGGVKLDPGRPSHRAQTEYCEGEAFGPCHQWPVHRANLCGALAKALPEEKLACDTSPPGPAELPTWPAADTKTAAKAKAPCRLSECGVPQGPMANQLPAGLVQQGFGNCNGCTFQVPDAGGTMTLAGTPTVDPSNLNMDWYTATLNTDNNQSYPLSVTFGTSMTGTQLSGVMANTSASSITWVIKVHNVSHTTVNVSTLTRVPPY